MKLSQLLESIGDSSQHANDIDIVGISHHTGTLSLGYAFVAIKGSTFHGNDFIPEAIIKGAACILTDTLPTRHYDVPIICIVSLKEHLSVLAQAVYPRARTKRIIAITGTNGKTTTASFLSQSLTHLGINTQIIGTLTHERTTPDIFSLYALLHYSDTQYSIIEVSSHALVQGRTQGLEFELAIWTNLTTEHLDYHGSMDNYLQAKLLILKQSKYGIFNADAQYFHDFAQRLTHSSYSLSELTYTVKPFGFLCNCDATIFEVNILGIHNLYNMLACYKVLISLGYSTLQSITVLSQIVAPKGRLEHIYDPQSLSKDTGYEVFVDYAHTPDALEHSLTTLSSHIGRDITLIFGCGGDRDSSKRAKMGKIASQHASRIILTNDNPRSEEPQKIINDIVEGISSSYEVILERELAIIAALEDKDTHTILIAGKGHEQYQIIGDKTTEFSDSTTVLKYL